MTGRGERTPRVRDRGEGIAGDETLVLAIVGNTERWGEGLGWAHT